MKLTLLILKYISDDKIKYFLIKNLEAKHTDVDLPYFLQLITDLKSFNLLTLSSVNHFLTEYDNSEAKVKKYIIVILSRIFKDVLFTYEKINAALILDIETKLQKKIILHFKANDIGIHKYHAIFNLYYLIKKKLFTINLIDHYEVKITSLLNALILTASIPNSFNILDLQVKGPLIPKFLTNIDKSIKNNPHIYPYRFKIEDDDKQEEKKIKYIKLTDGKEEYFFVETGANLSQTLIAAELAKYINAELFPEITLWGVNSLKGKKINHYLHSLENIKEIVKDEFYISGIGIIDEVMNFLCDKETNLHHIGLSDFNLRAAQFCKINFTQCDLLASLDDHYEKNILSKMLNISHPLDYQREKLMAKIKFTILSADIIDAILKKAPSDLTGISQSLLKRVERCKKEVFSYPEARNFLINEKKMIANEMVINILDECELFFKANYAENYREFMIEVKINMAQLILFFVVDNNKDDKLSAVKKTILGKINDYVSPPQKTGFSKLVNSDLWMNPHLSQLKRLLILELKDFIERNEFLSVSHLIKVMDNVFLINHRLKEFEKKLTFKGKPDDTLMRNFFKLLMLSFPYFNLNKDFYMIGDSINDFVNRFLDNLELKTGDDYKMGRSPIAISHRVNSLVAEIESLLKNESNSESKFNSSIGSSHSFG